MPTLRLRGDRRSRGTGLTIAKGRSRCETGVIGQPLELRIIHMGLESREQKIGRVGSARGTATGLILRTNISSP